MANQHKLTEVPVQDRKAILDRYEAGIGVDAIVREMPYGRDIIRRVLREEKTPRMNKGNQVKYAASCPDNKVCCICKQEKPKAAFSIQRRGTKDGLRSHCRECRTKLERKTFMIRQYGITQEEYNTLFEAQKGLCACCGTAENTKRKGITLSIDHDHETGKVRQLLCHHCNLAIGLLNDSIERCEQIKAYLTRHK